MKKLPGFSLAEVLITMAVVGFIAAITLPSLQMNVEKQKVGPSLMKAVNTLEVANSVALQVEEASTLDEIAGDADKTDYLGTILKDYTKLVEVEYDAPNSPISGTFFATKDGIMLTCNGLEEGKANADVKTSGSYYEVMADINGSKGPNVEGKDIFKLYVDTKGLVIPYGSNLGKDYQDGWESWTEGCKSIKKGDKSKTAPTNAETCAGSIVDNGGRVLYFYEGLNASSGS